MRRDCSNQEINEIQLLFEVVDGKKVSLLMQNAETIRLTAKDGKPVSITHMNVGDEVLAYFQEGGRHFGQAVKETIVEK